MIYSHTLANAARQDAAVLPETQSSPAMQAPGAAPLHRLQAVRVREGISRKAVARRLKITIEEVSRQECETTDLPISVLRRWQQVLEVPMAELLEEPDDGLSLPLLKRARLLQLMKTVNTIARLAKQRSVHHLVRMLHEQLVEIMPELALVKDWPIVGHRRASSELGRAAERRLDDRLFGPHEQ